MNRPLRVDMFVEDRAHEDLLRPLIRRVAQGEGRQLSLQVRSGRGGHGRAIREFKNYQVLASKGLVGSSSPDLLVVGIDGNCTSFAQMRAEIEQATRGEFRHLLVTACPDPHVERWYMADPQSFHEVVGLTPVVGQRKCEREHYKRLLSSAVTEAGHPPTLGGIEFARDLVEKMDFFRAGKTNPSFNAFLQELRGGVKRALEDPSAAGDLGDDGGV
ncbi:MAG: hypothetical protein OXK79_04145 [Chloroflexota bacterium]|nr:hypothetical protein [Chloroflexota bacterium]